MAIPMVVIDWKEKIPFKLACPRCQTYSNLHPHEWQYFLPESYEPVEDYHVCPGCWRMWRILRPHQNAIPNGKHSS